MTRFQTGRSRFGLSILLAASAAATLPATVILLGRMLGPGAAVGLHGVAVIAAYALLLAPSWRRGFGAAGFALGLGLLGVVALAGRGLVPSAGLAVGGVVLLGLVRSVLLHRVGVARGLGTELGLGVAGIGLAAGLVGPSLLGVAAAFWGFFLIQSLYPLLPGLRPVGEAADGRDPFERAASRLGSLLEPS